MVVPDSCKQLPVEPYRASRKSCRLLGANALTSLKNTGRHNATAYANAVPDGARPDSLRLPSSTPQTTLLPLGTHDPKTMHGPYPTTRKPPLPGEVSPRVSHCCQPPFRVATRSRQSPIQTSEEVFLFDMRALEALLHQRVRCSNHHFW